MSFSVLDDSKVTHTAFYLKAFCQPIPIIAAMIVPFWHYHGVYHRTTSNLKPLFLIG